MDSTVVTRPVFSEGQILSASALDLGVDYARESLERHSAMAHAFGVVEGMRLTFKPQAPPGTANDAYVSVGMAVDRNGMQINVLTDTLLLAGTLGSQPAGWYPAYVWVSDENGPTRRAVDPCSNSSAGTIIERPNAAFILDTSITTGATSPYVCIGQAYWDPIAKGLGDNGHPPAMSTGRRLAGVRVGEVVATEGVINVRADNDDPNKQATDVKIIGTLRAAQAAGAGGIIGSDGGALELRDPSGQKKVTAAYTASSLGGNELLVTVGDSSDPKNVFAIAADSHGTIAASIDASGNIHATGRTTIDASITVGSGQTITLGPTAAPTNPIGVVATGDLALQFGTNSRAVVYDSTGQPVAEFDPTMLKVFKTGGELRAGQLVSGNLGVGCTAGAFDVHAPNGDLNVMTPNNLNFEAPNLNINGVPVWQTIGTAHVLRLGPLGICFGRQTWNGQSNDAGSTMTITFPAAFSSSPQVFLSPVVFGGKRLAVLEQVSTTQAVVTMLHFTPDNPNDGDGTTWRNDNAGVDVCWVALGTF